MSTLLIIFVMIFVLGPIAKAYADRISKAPLPEGDAHRAELGRLKEEVEKLAVEVARLQDEQSFMVRLLSDGQRQKLLEGRGEDE